MAPRFSSWQFFRFTQHLTSPWPLSLDNQKQTLHQMENLIQYCAWRKSLQVCVYVCMCVWVTCVKRCGHAQVCICTTSISPILPMPLHGCASVDTCGYVCLCQVCGRIFIVPRVFLLFFFPRFFHMWENRLLLLWLKCWVQLFGTEKRAAERNSNAQKMKVESCPVFFLQCCLY